jgi:hypothetical protein
MAEPRALARRKDDRLLHHPSLCLSNAAAIRH